MTSSTTLHHLVACNLVLVMLLSLWRHFLLLRASPLRPRHLQVSRVDRLMVHLSVGWGITPTRRTTLVVAAGLTHHFSRLVSFGRNGWSFTNQLAVRCCGRKGKTRETCLHCRCVVIRVYVSWEIPVLLVAHHRVTPGRSRHGNGGVDCRGVLVVVGVVGELVSGVYGVRGWWHVVVVFVWRHDGATYCLVTMVMMTSKLDVFFQQALCLFASWSVKK